jgi:hypothetical protein
VIYVLIFTLLTYKGGVQTTAVEFNNIEACQAAAKEVSKQIMAADSRPDWNMKNPIILCAAKGKA